MRTTARFNIIRDDHRGREAGPMSAFPREVLRENFYSFIAALYSVSRFFG